ncbi:hypothetical protein ABW20_dc0106772 [Dactylellina cionopaga]|nr:hypothetical protein ABW20_dc0106772 [Dactylellina cionopaga]
MYLYRIPIVVPKLGKLDPTTGTPSKYFFLTQVQNIDTAILEQSLFWYDTVTKKVYSETTVQIPGSGDQKTDIKFTTSLEEDLYQDDDGDHGAEIKLDAAVDDHEVLIQDTTKIATNNGNAAADSGADLPPALLDLDFNTGTVTERWEVFGDVNKEDEELSGLLRAANLGPEPASENSLSEGAEELQAAYGGNIMLNWNMMMGLAGEAQDQLWLWRCSTPLGNEILSKFPNMDAAARAEYFKNLSHLLLVRPKFKDMGTKTPEIYNSWEFDGQPCFKIHPWKSVLAMPGMNALTDDADRCIWKLTKQEADNFRFP